jgi:hypothetical protein
MTAAFDHDSFDSRFVNGERTIGVSDPVNAAAAGTYRIARFMDLPHGIYNLKLLGTGAVTLRIGATLETLAVVNTSTGGTLANTQVYVPGGPLRYDIELVAAGGGAATGVMFLIYSPDKIIYASNAAGWEFDTTALADTALTPADDPRRSLPVLSVLPNWAKGVSERVEYLSNPLSSETGAIQSRTLREKPRRSFEYDFMRTNLTRARLDAFLTGTGRSDHLMPMWHEQHRPTGGFPSGQSYLQFPAATLSLREFRAGDLVIVTNGDANDFDVLEVDSLNLGNDRLTWVTPPTRTWPEGTRVAPLRVAVISDKSSMRNITDRVGTVSLRCQLKERDDGFEPSWGHCSPLWRFRVNRADPIQIDHDRLSYTFDNETGVPHTVDPGGRAMLSTRVQGVFKGRSEVVALRRFIAAASGRVRRFWMPSLTRDVMPASDISGNTIIAQPSGLAEYVRTQQSARAMIGILLADGSPTIYREIVAVAPLGATIPPYRPTAEVLTLSADVPATRMADIERIQFMVPSRFDQDAFELSHMVDESAVVRSSFVLRSADIEGMPPIDCGVTSWPYHVVSEDALDVSSVITMIGFGGFGYHEEVDVESTVAEVSLVNADNAYRPDDEAVDVSSAMTSISLPTILLTYRPDDEAVDVSSAMTSISLPTILLTYRPDDEAVDVSSAMTSISLQ